MSPRRAAVLAVALALAACHDVTQEPRPADLVFATFSSKTSTLPQPNDIALAATPTLTLPQQQAQKQLLQAFIAAGGFPADQEVPITIPLRALTLSGGDYVDATTPTLDAATVVLPGGTNPATVAVIQVNATGGPAVVPVEPVITPGLLTLRKVPDANGRRWPAGGRFVVAVRGGAQGVKTTGGLPVQPDAATALILENRDLTIHENQPLGAVPDDNKNGTNADEIQGLELLRRTLWNPVPWCNAGGAWAPVTSAAVLAACAAAPFAPTSSPLALAASLGGIPAAEVAVAQSFGVAPRPSASNQVLIDAGSGVAPLPIDLLRTGPNGTIAQNPAFGPAAAGLATLDGFSTTAMLLAQTLGPIDSSTVHGANVHLFRLTKDSTGAVTGVALVKELKHELAKAQGGDITATPSAAGYVAQPNQISVNAVDGSACTNVTSAGCVSPAIGLQPAVTAPTPAGAFFLPPLAENATYALLVTNRVKDAAGQALVRPTIGKILLDLTAPVALGGQSALGGVDAATAQALERMRGELAEVMKHLPAETTAAQVVVGWTFKTQSTTGTSLAPSAMPFGIEAGAGAALFTPSAVVALTPPVEQAGVSFYDVTFKSVDAIDKSTGALRPTLAADVASPATLGPLLVDLHALVAVPTAGGAAKLVVFGHGLNGSKETLFATAASLAARGFIAAAIDFPLHGGRNWCSANTDCDDGGSPGVCTPFPGAAGQGDAIPPGQCTTGVTKVFSAPGVNIGSRYFIGANFFRARDAFRQNLIDQSALALALARPPAPLAPQPTPNLFAVELAARTPPVGVDPSTVYYEGISLGSISGTSVVATNPRITRAALSVGGGTVVDVLTNSPTFKPLVDGLFLSLGIDRSKIATDPVVAANYLRFVNIIKWIVDPGDPINYAIHLKAAPLPNLLANPPALQAAKEVFAQVATGDTVVPNPFNLLLDNLSQASTIIYALSPAGGSVPHDILARVDQCKSDAAGYLADLTVPPTPRLISLP